MIVEKPTRAIRTYVQDLAAPPARVFPLLCPVRETEWVEGWDPIFVASASGLAEADCVFVTRGAPQDAVWYVVRHEPPREVEFVKITPGVTACRITISLTPSGPDRTAARVTYAHTAIGEAGRSFVEGFTEAFYREFMRRWEDALNGHLIREGG